MKRIIISLSLLLSIATYSYAGFYVIPIPREVEVIKEVCTGTPIGERVFKLVNAWSVSLKIDNIFQTTTAKLIIITGTSGYPHYHSDDYPTRNPDDAFYRAPEVLPEPASGVKGTFYFVDEDGDIAYAKYL